MYIVEGSLALKLPTYAYACLCFPCVTPSYSSLLSWPLV